MGKFSWIEQIVDVQKNNLEPYRGYHNFLILKTKFGGQEYQRV